LILTGRDFLEATAERSAVSDFFDAASTAFAMGRVIKTMAAVAKRRTTREKCFVCLVMMLVLAWCVALEPSAMRPKEREKLLTV
jgi:hypothetical protein